MNHFFSATLMASAIVVGLLCAPLPGSAAHAAGAVPALASQQLTQDSGRIDTIEFEHDAILIDDRGYTITHDVPVHTDGITSSRTALRVGAKIRFNYFYDGPRPVITEAWLTSR